MTAPTPEHFAAAVGAAGLGSEHRVVLYDRRQDMWAVHSPLTVSVTPI